MAFFRQETACLQCSDTTISYTYFPVLIKTSSVWNSDCSLCWLMSVVVGGLHNNPPACAALH